MVHHVTFFPPWPNTPYLAGLAAGLAAEGWRVELVGRKGLFQALVRAALGRGTVHLHWYEGFTLGRNWTGGLVAWLFLPLLWLAGRRGRLIWTVHNLVPHEGYGLFLGPGFVRLLARASTRLLVHFEAHREEVERRLGVPGKVFVTPPAGYGRLHGSPVERGEARARAGYPADDDLMLFVQFGPLRRYRQPATTIHAFRDAAPSDARLLVAGACFDAHLMEEMHAAAAGDPRITIRTDRLSDPELLAALCAADWAILPYVAIYYPGAVSVAVAYGCPLIAPDLPGVRALAAGHPAILYPPGVPTRPALADAVRAASERAASERAAYRRPLRARPPQPTWREQARDTIAHYSP